MYISRRVDIIGPPVWKSTISPCLSKSELASLRLWQSEHQQHTLSPLHCHMLTPPGYPTAPSCTQNPSNVECDRDPSCTYKDKVVVVSVPHDGGWEDWWRGGMVGYTPGGTAPPLRLSPCRPQGSYTWIYPEGKT